MGVLLSPKATFGKYVDERVPRATAAMAFIRRPQKLSVQTAAALFNIRVAPVASYGIQVAWESLTSPQLRSLDKVKAAFLKKALGLPKSARNTATYQLAGALPFIEDLVKRFSLPATPALHEFRQEYSRKVRAIDHEFYLTPAMRSAEWKKPLQSGRHLVTRYALHGFHHRLCLDPRFHVPNSRCTCKYCGGPCELYHLPACPAAPPISELGGGAC